MTNLTIALDESIIRIARVRAIQEGTSVSAKVREFLAQYAQNSDALAIEKQRKAGEAILAMARARQVVPADDTPKPNSTASSGGYKFDRDEANDRYPTWPPQRNHSAQP